MNIDNIPLIIGNESNEIPFRVSLKQYLSDIKSCQSNPSAWIANKNLYCPSKDEKIFFSAHLCLLPTLNGSAKFNVRIFNNSSSTTNPTVLTVVATHNGTSCQLIKNAANGQLIPFNLNGGKSCFSSSSNPLENQILIFQIPILVESSLYPPLRFGYHDGTETSPQSLFSNFDGISFKRDPKFSIRAFMLLYKKIEKDQINIDYTEISSRFENCMKIIE